MNKWEMVEVHCFNTQELRFWQRLATEQGIRSKRVRWYSCVTDGDGVISGIVAFAHDSPTPKPRLESGRDAIKATRRIARLRTKWANKSKA
jgi:hypothetical protein